MPIDYTALPIQPPAPLPTSATDAQRAAWLDQHRICASYANAESQKATAEAMEKAAAAQQAIADLGAAPEVFNERAFAESVAVALAPSPLRPNEIAEKAAGIAKQLAQEFAA